MTTTLARRWLALLLSFALVIAGTPLGGAAWALADGATPGADVATQPEAPSFSSLADPALLDYLEAQIYDHLIDDLDGADCFVQNVTTTYVSKEYLQEVAYNSQANVYFGYSLADVEAQFAGEKFVFTLGEDGQTVARTFEGYDGTYDQAVQDLAVGGGVILACVTVSVLTGGAAAPTMVSAVFAMGAKSAAVMAVSGGVISAAMAGVATAASGADAESALKAAASAGADGFMWGAVGGALTGGVTEAATITGVARVIAGTGLGGLTVREATLLQRTTKWPASVIKQIHSGAEAGIYERAGLSAAKVNGKSALTRRIDWKQTETLANGTVRTNAQRVADGLAPLDPTGKPYELHHVGQADDASFAILTRAEHMSGGNNKVLHWKNGASEVDHGGAWEKAKDDFWSALAQEQLAAAA